MVLTCNGFPKSGSHLLVRACELLGVPASVRHIPFSEGVPEDTTHHIFIKRNPRDLPISLLRWKNLPVTVGMYLTKYRLFMSYPLRTEMLEYADWLTDANTFVVSFEALLRDDAELRRIAEYLGVPYIDGAFEDLPGFTVTWIDGNHADHRSIWCDQIEQAWQLEGGAEIQATFGY